MVKGGLRLKRELIPAPVQQPDLNLPVAKIWVDSSVYHLDQEFSYLVPVNLSATAQVGALVSIPFNGRDVVGVVIARSSKVSSGLKSISKVIGTIPLLAPEIIQLIADAAKRYAAHPFDLIRSAVPERMASIEKEFIYHPLEQMPNLKPSKPQYLQLPPAKARQELMAKKVADLSRDGGVIVVLPDSREVRSLSHQLDLAGIAHTVLDSHLGKSEYFRNFLSVRTGASNIVIGTRSSIFAPVHNLAHLVIFNEGSEHFYEQRSPGWNVRDIALLRSRGSGAQLHFIGYSPSAEVGRLIDEGWVDFKRTRGKVRVSTISQPHGELIPSRAIAPIKSALSSGPVLFLVPLKGYAQAIRCGKCKTISRCECGGAHQKTSANALISCSHCLKAVPSWKCIWCHGDQPSLLSRGIDRHLHEIGLLFPGVPARLSTGDHPITEDVENGIVVTTPSMAPSTSAGYSAVVILEGNRFLNQPDMRSSERVREMYFSHAALAKSGAPVILIQDDGNPISTALSTWNPTVAIHHDLAERAQLSLPPYVRTATLTMEKSEVIRFKNALETAHEEGRLPLTTRILGPISKDERATLILTAAIAESESLVATLHEFMRRRSAAKKPLPTLRIDPYSLSR